MERKLIVTLLQKNIQELAMITEGFMEMTKYPAVIIRLARQKTEDILDYVRQLEEIKNENNQSETIITPIVMKESVEISIENEKEPIEKNIIDETLPIIEEEDISTEELIEESEEEEFVLNEMTAAEKEEEEERVEELQEPAEEIIQEDLLEKNAIAEASVEKEEEEDHTIEEKDDILDEQKEKEEQKTSDSEFVNGSPKNGIEERVTKKVGENDNTIAGAHTNKKIDDIRHAISIGDRFRFQRELFEGNGELLNKTLSKLNQMNDFYEASAYLQSKFKWNDEDETVESFYMIVKRRYL